MDYGKVFEALTADPVIAKFLDITLEPPSPFRGTGPIKLIILGQDPTVKNVKSRSKIKTVLNLDRSGSLRRYLDRVCRFLGLDLDANVYATNYVNVFFKVPPTSVIEQGLLHRASVQLRSKLDEELSQFPGIPVLSLGQPLLELLVLPGISSSVVDYWGYRPDRKTGRFDAFKHLSPEENLLQRNLFPFPHQPSMAKEFYSQRLREYAVYMQRTAMRDSA